MATEDSAFSNLFYHDDDWDTSTAARARFRVDASHIILALTLVGLAAMVFSYAITLKPITLQLNQRTVSVLSNQTTVGGVLNDAAIKLHPEDVVFPALDAPLPKNQPISIRLARPLEIQVDGDKITRRTQTNTLAEALRETGVLLKRGDRLLVNGQWLEPNAPITHANDDPQLTITVQRAIPLQVDDNGAVTTLYTTAPTIGEALRQAGLVVYLGDYVTPSLGTPVEPGWQVYIRRSRAATINVDGKTIQTRTRSETIASMLLQEDIELKDKDYTIPEATAFPRDGISVQVMRVREELNTESEYIPYETLYQGDPTLEIDQQKVTQTGIEGVKKRTIRVLYENNREVKRTLDREWIEATPVAKIINYGTKIVQHDLTLPDGTTTTYWRKLRILATSYTAATSGKARTHPEFGVTYTGMRAGVGIVAVDPNVINLRANVYVPGYGTAIAGDTGGRIKGKRIDLGYDESNLVLWYQWVDVYLLGTPPPASQIHWIIPDTPKERTTRH